MAYITLNKKHFFHNLDIIANQTKSKDKIALVLKDNAYGHGLVEIASMAQEYGITKAVVRCNVEAKMIEQYFDYILILAETTSEVSEKFYYAINDIASIQNFAKGTKVHLKIDTGMHRNGIVPQELEDAIALIQEAQLKLEALFTHHCCADDTNGLYELQQHTFQQIVQKYPKLAHHSANSAALFRSGLAEGEVFARVGIAAYGCLQMYDGFEPLELQPVLSLYAHKISSRKIDTKESVGYNATFSATQPTYITTYDVGYGDGFLRSCSSKYITPDGVAIAGRISMDNSSFCTQKDELLLFDNANYCATYAGTIGYEVLTSLKHYIQRKII